MPVERFFASCRGLSFACGLGVGSWSMPTRWPTVTSLTLPDNNGCDWWRVIVPFVHLKDNGFPVWVAFYPVGVNKDGADLVHKPDVLVMPRAGIGKTNNDASRFVSICHENKTAVGIDIDDAMDLVPLFSPHHSDDLLVEAGTRALAAVDFITTTTECLAERLRKFNPNVSVLPNLIDPDQWRWTTARPSQPLTVGISGGTSHVRDWNLCESLFEKLGERFPEIKFLVVGFDPPWAKRLREKLGDRLEIVGWQPAESYQETIRRIDIGLAPLEDIEFNSYKSPIKWFEYSLAGAATIASETVYGDYIRNEYNGLIVENGGDWLPVVSCLIGQPFLRTKLVRKAREHVIAHWSIHDPKELRKRMRVYRDAYTRTIGGVYD